MKRMNEKWNYTLHTLLDSRLESKQVNINSRLAKFQNKTKTKLHKIFAASCRHFSLVKVCQVKHIIKKQTRAKIVL